MKSIFQDIESNTRRHVVVASNTLARTGIVYRDFVQRSIVPLDLRVVRSSQARTDYLDGGSVRFMWVRDREQLVGLHIDRIYLDSVEFSQSQWDILAYWKCFTGQELEVTP